MVQSTQAFPCLLIHGGISPGWLQCTPDLGEFSHNKILLGTRDEVEQSGAEGWVLTLS